VERDFGEVANQEIVTRDVSLGVESNPHLERTETLEAWQQRTLDEADGADHTAVATFRERLLGVAHAQTNHVQTPPAVQTCDRGSMRHRRGV
jgi:hypothetical protein